MRFTLFFLIVLSAQLAFANKFIVESFKTDRGDLAARLYERKDVNNDVCALIKIRTDIQGLKFDVNTNITGNIDYKQGDYWVYVSQNEKRLKIISQDGSITTLEYLLPVKIESSMVYLLQLTSDYKPNQADANLFTLNFEINQSEVFISKDNTAPAKCIGNKSIFKLPKGDFNFKFNKEGFNDFDKKISIKKDTLVIIVLEPGSGTKNQKLPGIITITSEPAGAEVFLNDQKMGLTPYNEQLNPGYYDLILRKNLYHPYSSHFLVEEGQSKTLPNINLSAMFGSLEVNSTIEETEIFIDNKSRGIAPVSIKQLESGKHTVRAENKWYHADQKEVLVEDKKSGIINFKLNPSFGELNIISEPDSAEVFIDGEKMGITPLKIKKIASNKYSVLLKKSMYTGTEDNIEVFDGQKNEKKYVLAKKLGNVKDYGSFL